MATLLIADDEKSYRDVLQVIFEDLGHSVHAVSDGRSALAHLKKSLCDLVISDVRMPDMDGIEFLRAAREFYPEIGIVMMTAFGTIDTAREAFKLGADDFLATKDPETFKANAGRFSFILDTVSATHDYNAYLGMLARGGTMVLVGAPDATPLSAFSLIVGRRRLAGSLIGGIAETQEMLDFCAKHDVASDIELIPIDKINEAYDRMLRNDVRYRFVIDIASLKRWSAP